LQSRILSGIFKINGKAMSKPQDKRQRQMKIARLEIVAQMYKRGHSLRNIRAEVMKRLELKSYSISTVHKDIQSLLKEWRENRIEDIDAALQLELERIDDTCRELWDQWEKSKVDYVKTARKQKGSPARDNQTGATAIRTYQTERTEIEVYGLGDTSYISEIRQQLAERRKLLGLYAPEKKDISGNLSFASFLIESGLIDDADPSGSE
jgi:hypothetical protein